MFSLMCVFWLFAQSYRDAACPVSQVLHIVHMPLMWRHVQRGGGFAPPHPPLLPLPFCMSACVSAPELDAHVCMRVCTYVDISSL